MHNQDTTKDDILEAIFELITRTEDYYKRYKKQEFQERESIDSSGQIDSNEKISKFQNAMQSIIESDADDRIKGIAKTFHDNPKESMKMLQSVISGQVIEQANELVGLTTETSNMIQLMRSNIDMSKPYAMDQLAILNQLNSQEEKKGKIANSILNELKTFELEEDNFMVNTGKEKMQADINSPEIKSIVESVNAYAKKVIDFSKFEVDYNGAFISEDKLIMRFNDINDSWSGKLIEYDLKTKNGAVYSLYATEEKGSWVTKRNTLETFTSQDLERDSNNQNELEYKNEDVHLDGPER